MKIRKFQVDAFAEKVFQGNPAVVCPLDEFLTDEMMQNIAMEHNLSETAFIVLQDSEYAIRWFTPKAEVELCGHATLASAFVIFNELGHEGQQIKFNTVYRGQVTVEKQGSLYILDFPSTPIQPSAVDKAQYESILSREIVSHHDGLTDTIIQLESEHQVQSLNPDMRRLAAIDRRGIIVTSRSDQYDFVSRFFAPRVGVDEDPVTGSAHTLLIPFWSKILNKKRMIAKQISSRGGILHCEDHGKRVKIGGKASLYSKGEIYLPD